MRLGFLPILGVLLLPLACDPAKELQNQAAAAGLAQEGQTQAAPNYPAPGTCTTDNSDPNYTCKTCTSSGGGVITITCTPKTKLFNAWW